MNLLAPALNYRVLSNLGLTVEPGSNSDLGCLDSMFAGHVGLRQFPHELLARCGCVTL